MNTRPSFQFAVTCLLVGACPPGAAQSSTIVQSAYVKASNTNDRDLFGKSVAIDQDTIVVSASSEDSAGAGVNSGTQSNNSAPFSGAAYVFTRSGTTWTQEAYLKASNSQSGDYFGWAVDTSQNTVVVGAYGEDSRGTGVNGGMQGNNSEPGAGAAYVFKRQGTTWTQEAYLKAFNTDRHDGFGGVVGICGDSLVVGARGEASIGTGVNSGMEADNSAGSSGAAYVFTRTDTTWSQRDYIKASNTEWLDSLTNSIGISNGVIVAGAASEASNGTGVNGGAQADNSMPYAGAVYVLDRISIGSSYCSPAVPNATGSPAALAVLGSDAVIMNDVSLRCDQMPRHLFGVFLTGRMQGLIISPAGSQGNLCLGGAYGHFAGPGQIQNSGATGTIELALDLRSFPSSTGQVSVQVGETWSFQCWFRDEAGGAPTSNFSDGVGVLFR